MVTKNRVQYAAYDNEDNFLDIGTAEEMACKFDMTAQNVRRNAIDTKRSTSKRKNEGVRFFSMGVLDEVEV